MNLAHILLATLTFHQMSAAPLSLFDSEDASRKPIPAHAHNDYYQERPLLDAIQFNFRSVEADIYSRGDSLYVAHDRNEITPGRTLRSLYLDPLDSLIRMNGGTLYHEQTPLILLADIKDRGTNTYRLLHEILEDYIHLLAIYSGGGIKPGDLMIIVSGNRPIRFMEEQNERYAFVDGRLSDLDDDYPPELMPLISDHWGRTFNWKGSGEMPENERERLLKIVNQAHRNGQLIRFWATPDHPGEERTAVWRELLEVGVDLMNTDDLEGLHAFLADL